MAPCGPTLKGMLLSEDRRPSCRTSIHRTRSYLSAKSGLRTKFTYSSEREIKVGSCFDKMCPARYKRRACGSFPFVFDQSRSPLIATVRVRPSSVQVVVRTFPTEATTVGDGSACAEAIVGEWKPQRKMIATVQTQIGFGRVNN